MEFSKEDARKCEELKSQVDNIIAKIVPATGNLVELIRGEEMPVLTTNAEAVENATNTSFVPLLKELSETLEKAVTAFKVTEKAAGGVN